MRVDHDEHYAKRVEKGRRRLAYNRIFRPDKEDVYAANLLFRAKMAQSRRNSRTLYVLVRKK